MLKWLTGRLDEPSTWAGIAATILGALGISDTGGALDPQFFAAVGTVVAGLVAFAKKGK